jgi:hypothetical protein
MRMEEKEEVDNPMAQLYLVGEKPAVTHIGLTISIRQLDAVWRADQRNRPVTAHATGRH